MIGTVLDTTKKLLKAEGFVEAAGEDTIQDRRYTLRVGTLASRNADRGSMGSGVLRVDREIDVRVQYVSDQHYERRLVEVIDDQKAIIGALSRSDALGGTFTESGVEEVGGGIVSRMTFSFPGKLT